MLGQLRAIRAELPEIKLGLASKASLAQAAEVGRNLTGLSHLVLSGFGSVVQLLKSISAFPGWNASAFEHAVFPDKARAPETATSRATRMRYSS
jgi:hypothetical protein